MGKEGLLGIETEGKRLPTQATGAPQRLVCCVVWQCGRRRWAEVTGVWRQGWGQWEWSCPVPEGNGSSVRKRVARHSHCSSSEDSWEMPSSSSFSSFLGLPLGFLPGVVVVFRVLAAPLFLLPFGLPRGLLGVGTSLGSFGGCLRGLPRPRFSVPSFSCLEAKGWLDFELDSLIFPYLRSRWMRELGRRPVVRAPGC